MFDASAFGDTDTINSFLVGIGTTSDMLDLSELFTVTSGAALSTYAQLIVDPANAANSLVQVDVDGAGIVNTWTTIAKLTGVANVSDCFNSLRQRYDNC